MSGWRKPYVHLGLEKLVEYSNGTTYFYHADHLGTPRVQTDMTGSAVETWGLRKSQVPGFQSPSEVDVGTLGSWFLGARNCDISRQYAGARYYNGARARLMSADPVLGDVSNPQRLNRYAYVLNDPVNCVENGVRHEFRL